MTIRFLGAALSLASLVSPTIAAAQVADRAGAPSGTAPLQAPCVVQDNGTCAAVKASVPLPTQDADGTPITSVPLSGNGTFFVIDTTGYRGLTIGLSGQSGQATFSIEGSNDGGASWQSLQLMDVRNGAYTTSTQTAGLIFYTPALTKLIRARLSAYSAGTWNVSAFLKQVNVDPGNVVISGGNGAVVSAQNVGTSGQGNTIGLVTNSRNYLWNGGTADLWFTANGAYSAGNLGGVAAVSNMCLASNGTPGAVAVGAVQRPWCGLNGQTIIGTGNNGGTPFSNVWASANALGDSNGSARPLVVSPLAASGGNAAVAQLDASAAAGSSTGAGILGVGNLGWTGSGYQRMRILPDGTQVVSDVDGAPVPFTPGGAINAILFSTPTTGYAGVSYQANGSWSGTVSIEGSNDASADCQTGGTWFGLTSMNLNGGNPSTTINGNTGLFIPAATTCARARVSGYNSGSFTGVAVLRSLTPLPSTTQVNNYKAQFNSEVNNGSVAASAAKINYTTRDLGGGTVNYSRFTCYFDPGAASAGALGHIEGSPDNSNWTPLLPPVDLSAVTPVTRESRVFYRYNRCAFTNGSAAQTGLYVASQYGD